MPDRWFIIGMEVCVLAGVALVVVMLLWAIIQTVRKL